MKFSILMIHPTYEIVIILIKKQNGNLEVVAKITDSMVQEFGCRIKYNKESGLIDLVGEEHCKAVVTEVITDMIEG